MNQATTEEVSFAVLMGVLSIFFVICWVPQLVSQWRMLWLPPPVLLKEGKGQWGKGL